MTTLATVSTDHASITQASIEATKNQLAMLEKFVDSALEIDRDYGPIPGTSGKPTLLKPGAHNIMAAMECYSNPSVYSRDIDPKTGFFYVEFKTEIVHRPTGQIVAVGYGSCNSYERKYRYRNMSKSCPHCETESIIKGKAEYGGGWLCWKRQGGCGAKFDDDDHLITSQVVGQVENTDLLDQANTYLKMAEKRADVDAAMKLPGVARFFTQDIGDDSDGSAPETVQAPPKPTEPVPDEKPPRQPRQTKAKLGNCEEDGKAWAPGEGGRIGHPLEGGGWHWKDEATTPAATDETPGLVAETFIEKAGDLGISEEALRDKLGSICGNNDLDAMSDATGATLMAWIDNGGDDPADPEQPEEQSAMGV